MPKNVGHLRGEPPHALLEGERLPLAHPLAEEIGRVARVAELIHVGAAVGEPDEEARIGDEGPHALRVLIHHREVEQGLEPVGERDVQDGVGGVLAARLRDLRHGFSR